MAGSPPQELLDEYRRELRGFLESGGDPAFLEREATLVSELGSAWLAAHTLRNSPDFAFDPSTGLASSGMSKTEAAIAAQVSATMRRAFWDQCSESIKAGQMDTVVARLEELLQTLGSFVSREDRRLALVARVDIDLVKQQIKHRTFDEASLVAVCEQIVSVLGELESPHQHAKTRRWHADFQPSSSPSLADAIVGALSFFFGQTDALRVEVKNVYISAVSLQERRKMELEAFQSLVTNGVVTLSVARTWLQSAVEAFGPPRGAVFMRRAVGLLIVKSLGSSIEVAQPLKIYDCPEPLRLDLQKLHKYQSEIQLVVFLAGIAVFAASLSVFPNCSQELLRTAFRQMGAALRDPNVSQSSLRTTLEQEVAVVWHAVQQPMNHAAFDQFFQQVIRCTKGLPVMNVFTSGRARP